MSVKTFENFRLLIRLFCVDCRHEQTFHFWGGEIFNREGDLILSHVNLNRLFTLQRL